MTRHITKDLEISSEEENFNKETFIELIKHHNDVLFFAETVLIVSFLIENVFLEGVIYN